MIKKFLRDDQWAIIKEKIAAKPSTTPRRRPPLPNRKSFEGILWMLWHGATWRELPPRYGSATTCRRRLLAWSEKLALHDMVLIYIAMISDQEKIAWHERMHGRRFKILRSRWNSARSISVPLALLIGLELRIIDECKPKSTY